MAIENIIAELSKEIARLRQARALLSSTGKVETKLTTAKVKIGGKSPKRGRPKKEGNRKAAKVVKRVLSPEARKAIGDAQRRRWAAQKSTAKKS